MKKIMMIGKIGCGKTTLGQRLTGETVMKKNVTVISAPAAPGVIDAKTVDKKITINLRTR